MKFKKVNGAEAVTLKKGVYKVHDIYEAEGLLYIVISSGFAQLRDRKETSIIGLKWIAINGIKTKRSSVFFALEIKK